MKRSTIFFILCSSVIFGIGLHSLLRPETPLFDSWRLYCIGIGALAVSGVCVAERKTHRSILYAGLGSAVVAAITLGIFRYSLATATSTLPLLKEIPLQGVIDRLPQVREKSIAYRMRVEGEHILVTLPPRSVYEYGDKLAIACVLQPLSPQEAYLRKEGISASCPFPKSVTVLAHGQGSPLFAYLFHIRAGFHEHLTALLPGTYGGLLAGILYGDTSGLSAVTKQMFRTVGLAHITALSGYNIAIISMVLLGRLIAVGLTRKQSFFVAVALIVLFVLMTGAEASVVRAAIMGLLVMLAQGIGRVARRRNLIVLAGAVMLMVNPLLLRFDLGFLLSFLSTIGLLWIAQDLSEHTLLKKLPKPLGIRQSGASSVASLLFTTPLILYAIGRIGPWSVVVNILVVPMVPLAMAFGFFAVLLDFIWHPLGIVGAALTKVPLGYMLSMAQYFSRFGAWEIQLSALAALVVFLLIVFFIWEWKKKLRHAESYVS